MDFSEHLIDSDIIVFAFASRRDEFSQGISDFEFGNTLRFLGMSHVLFRDLSERGYQEGIHGIGSVEDTVRYISGLARRYRRAVCLGLSMGANGALFYGQQALRSSDEIIAISPLTGGGEKVKQEFPQEQWRFFADTPEHDLKPLFPGGPIPRTIAYISDGDGTLTDRRMAERIGIADIRLIPGFAHGDLARSMRDMGMFKELLTP